MRRSNSTSADARCVAAAVALGCALALGGGAAEAQPATAMLRYENGTRLYGMQRFVEAAHEFEAAYALSQQAELLFNLGRAWEDAGETARALDAFVRFEAAGAPRYDLAQLRARIARLRGQLEAARPTPAAPSTAARVVVPPSPSASPRPGTPVGPIVLMSVGGAALLAAIPLWASARSTYDDLVAVCPMGSCPTVFEGDARRAARFAVAGDVLVGVGAASLAAGVTWLLFDRQRTPAEGARRATLGCAAGGCVVGVAGTF